MLLATMSMTFAPGSSTTSVEKTPTSSTPLPPTPDNPREVLVAVGAGRDTVAINAFFPQNIRVYQGETVTWNIVSDEIHTVTFMNPDDPIPAFPAPIPGGGPTDLMLNPVVAFATRLPGAPVETYGGAGLVSSGIFAEFRRPRATLKPGEAGVPLSETGPAKHGSSPKGTAWLLAVQGQTQEKGRVI